MKKRFTYIAISIIISTLLFLGTELAFGQGRYRSGSPEYSGKTRSDYPTRRGRDNYSIKTQQPNRDKSNWNDRKGKNNSYSYQSDHGQGKGNYGKSYGNNKSYNPYSYKHNKGKGNAYGHYKYGKGHSHGKWQKEVVVHQHYPRTYNAWDFPAKWKHSRQALVFRHSHGNYFYHQGRFYRYHPHRGYYVVNIPNTVVFTYLPVGYQEVMIGGTMYYRYGDLFFEWTPNGYRLARPISSFYIAAQF